MSDRGVDASDCLIVEGFLLRSLRYGEGVAVVPQNFQEGKEGDLSSSEDAVVSYRAFPSWAGRARPTESIGEAVGRGVHQVHLGSTMSTSLTALQYANLHAILNDIALCGENSRSHQADR